MSANIRFDDDNDDGDEIMNFHYTNDNNEVYFKYNKFESMSDLLRFLFQFRPTMIGLFAIGTFLWQKFG
jgi:hypothetical protein